MLMAWLVLLYTAFSLVRQALCTVGDLCYIVNANSMARPMLQRRLMLICP